MSVMHVEATKNPAVSDVERAVVKRVASAWLAWQKDGPVGIDYGMAQLARMVGEVDKLALKFDGAEKSEAELFAATVDVMNAYLDKPWKPTTLAKQTQVRRRLEGGKKKSTASDAYHLRTVELIAEAFPAWLEESGLGGFIRSLYEMLKMFDELFKSRVQDRSIEPDKLMFIISFETRERLGKIPSEMLQAIEFFNEVDTEAKIAAKATAKGKVKVKVRA